MRVIWSPAALRHIQHAYEYLQEINPSAAVALASGLLAAGESLEKLPHRGRSVYGSNMRELVTAHPYVIRYIIEGDTVLIARVRHTARRPTNP